ncbi:MAG TPA: VOC family protein [Luteitalea sp.]|nr:VOC family protein [Luteitalea sp.]
MHRFCRYALRTTDVTSASDFYRGVFGDRFWSEGVAVAELPAQAAARGAPAHWLGEIAVDGVDNVARRFIERGASRLGPPPSGHGDTRVVLRDPFGAILALTSRSLTPRSTSVAWHMLCARDEATAFATYAELFDWQSLGTLDQGATGGRHVLFSWDGSVDVAGSVCDLATRPGVHAQWLFFFATANLDDALARVRANGGLTLAVSDTPQGHRVAPCEDPQGAAFALIQARLV